MQTASSATHLMAKLSTHRSQLYNSYKERMQAHKQILTSCLATDSQTGMDSGVTALITLREVILSVCWMTCVMAQQAQATVLLTGRIPCSPYSMAYLVAYSLSIFRHCTVQDKATSMMFKVNSLFVAMCIDLW